MIKLIILDDHELVGMGIKGILDKEVDIQVEKVFTNPKLMDAYINQIQPHIILCDIKIKDVNGLDLIKTFKKLYSDIKFIALSGYNIESFKIRAFQNGASAYVLKEDTSEYLVTVIRDVFHQNEQNLIHHEMIVSELTPREIDILSLISRDLTNAQISEKFFMSKRNVEYHISSIIRKLNVSSRLGAVLRGIRLGLIEEDEIYHKGKNNL